MSGQKDSYYQTIVITRDFGMNPLCVFSAVSVCSELGKQNLENFRKLGVNLFQFKFNPIIRRKLTKLEFERFGNHCWPCHFGNFGCPARVAIAYNIPLMRDMVVLRN